MNVRTFRETDAEGLVALFTASIHLLAMAHYDAAQRHAWAPIPPDMEAWRQRFAGVYTLVAEEDGAHLGFISYEPDGHIDLLYTAPDSARRGVASILLREAAERLSALGVNELHAEASLVAEPFFSRHGFEITQVQDVTRRGLVFRRFAMRRQAQER